MRARRAPLLFLQKDRGTWRPRATRACANHRSLARPPVWARESNRPRHISKTRCAGHRVPRSGDSSALLLLHAKWLLGLLPAVSGHYSIPTHCFIRGVARIVCRLLSTTVRQKFSGNKTFLNDGNDLWFGQYFGRSGCTVGIIRLMGIQRRRDEMTKDGIA